MKRQMTSHSFFREVSGGFAVVRSWIWLRKSTDTEREVCIGLTQNEWERFFSAIIGVRIYIFFKLED